MFFLEWTARNGNIIQPRFYRLDESMPRRFEIYRDKKQRRTWICLWSLVFTTVPK